MRQRLRSSGLILLGGLAALALTSPACGETGPSPEQVVVISIDGMRPEFYQSPDWEAPTLKRLRSEGAWADKMLSVFPSLTYPNHTSMVTGVPAGVHGLQSNTAFDYERGPLPSWNFSYSLIQVPTIFSLARQAGVSTCAFSWPVTVGGPIDFNVPEIFHVDGVDLKTTAQLIAEHSTPGVLEEIRQVQPTFPTSFSEWDAWLPGAVTCVWKQHHPRLTCIHMLNMDWTQHHKGPDTPEAHEALKVLDSQVGRLLAALDPAKNLLLVVGDHGFQGYTHLVSPNRLFADHGWIKSGGHRIKGWTVVANPTGGSAEVFCKDPALEDQVLQLLQTEGKGRFRVLTRQDLKPMEAFPRALCALVAEPGYAFDKAFEGPLVRDLKAPLGQHGYLPESVPTGLLAWGWGVKPGKILGTLHVLDVAPTVARALNLKAEGMAGHPIDFGP